VPVDRVVPEDLDVDDPVERVPEEERVVELRGEAPVCVPEVREVLLPEPIVVRVLLRGVVPTVDRVVRESVFAFPAVLVVLPEFITVLDPRSFTPTAEDPANPPRFPETPLRPPRSASSFRLVKALRAIVAPRAP